MILISGYSELPLPCRRVQFTLYLMPSQNKNNLSDKKYKKEKEFFKNQVFQAYFVIQFSRESAIPCVKQISGVQLHRWVSEYVLKLSNIRSQLIRTDLGPTC